MVLKIHVISDLHLEFRDFALPGTDADVIVLAGDIGQGILGIQWIMSQDIKKPVIYVPGNHEFYYHGFGMMKSLRAFAPSNVHILNNESIDILGVKFLGATLWTDFNLSKDKKTAMDCAGRGIADFILIGDFNPAKSILLHEESRGFLEKNITKRSVVVTHHAPSPRSVHPDFANSSLNSAFASDLDRLMGKMDLWIHGHTHNFFDYDINGTRIVCNPRGYEGEKTGFEANYTVEI